VPSESILWKDRRPRTVFVNAGLYSFYNIVIQEYLAERYIAENVAGESSLEVS
jgi:hypothetical protein